ISWARFSAWRERQLPFPTLERLQGTGAAGMSEVFSSVLSVSSVVQYNQLGGATDARVGRQDRWSARCYVLLLALSAVGWPTSRPGACPDGVRCFARPYPETVSSVYAVGRTR